MSNAMEPLKQSQTDKLDYRIKRAFEIHFPNYEFRTFKGYQQPRYFYVVKKGVVDELAEWDWECCLDSLEALNGFMYGSVKAITGQLEHNENWDSNF